MRVVVLFVLGCCAWAAAHDCFTWGLREDMRLEYHVDAYDTVALSGQPVLVRHRQEEWSIECKHLGGDTLELLQRLERFTASERTSRGDSSLRQTADWVGQPARIVMTRRGWRLQSQPPLTSQLGIVPGSLFGPALFVPLDSGCVRCGAQQWLIECNDTLVEYAYPAPVLERIILARADSCSSAGKLLRISYAETSRGVHRAQSTDFAVATTGWTLAHGVVEIDTTYGLPTTLFYAQQIRLSIVGQQGHEHRGEQRTAFHARLTKIETVGARMQR